MPPLPIQTPILENLSCDPRGLTALGAFASSVQKLEKSRVCVDCSVVTWIDANMAAALGGLVALLSSNGCLVTFTGLRNSVKAVLSRNGFLHPKAIDRYGTSIPLSHFPLTSGKEFSRYADANLKGHGIPEMSPALRDRFRQGLNEIFNNCGLHSKSKLGVFACGQAYPGVKASVDFSIVDMGVGFKDNVNRYTGKSLRADEAIDWAMTDENTTRSGDIPGGIGLKIIREFVSLNKGSLTVFSGSGYWSQSCDGITMLDLPTRFPGTLVNLRINTADKASYKLKDEVDPNTLL